MQKILVRHGRTRDRTGDRVADNGLELALSACYGAAASGLGLEGDRAGQPLLRIGAQIMGFNVHAEAAIPARDRPRPERLCRHVFRPPIAQGRLEQQRSGKLRYTRSNAK